MAGSWHKDDFSIGEVAEILDIPAKMLRYWDRIGLLKPHLVDAENGYRRYSSSQFYLLNFIKFLKVLDVPYETIRSRLHETDIRSLVELLREQAAETDEKIRRLSAVKKTSLGLISDMEEALKTEDLDRVALRRLPERKIVFQAGPIGSRVEFERAIAKLERLIFGRPTLLVSYVGLMLDRDRLMEGRYDSYSAAFVPFGGYKAKAGDLRTLPAGEYAVMRFWGDIQSSGPRYGELAAFIREGGFESRGDMVRRCLAPGTIEGRHAHLAEIAVPVGRRARRK
jgi:DNA-binding transcriptional MerR regulator